MPLHYKSLFISVLLLCLLACRQSYEPKVVSTNYAYLVVEGVINTGARSVTTIKLSRTRNIGDSITANPQAGANITIVGKSGNTYQLFDNNDGTYTSDMLTLNESDEYALHIVTDDKRDYQSAFVTAKKSPDIDSLTWYHNASGLTVSVSTHDDANSSRYYRWEYSETWKYISTLESVYGVNNNGRVFIRDISNQVDSCWQSDNSSGILLGTSANLSQDVIAGDSIAGIPQNSEKATQRYSILVKQYVLTREAYEYWQLIQKNTQQLGSLFDAQPSQLASNITCTTNPSEPVIGYVVAGTASEKRLFITNHEAQPWVTIKSDGRDCQTRLVSVTGPSYLYYDYPDTSYTLYYLADETSVYIGRKFCLDCRLHGGTTDRPSFW